MAHESSTPNCSHEFVLLVGHDLLPVEQHLGDLALVQPAAKVQRGVDVLVALIYLRKNDLVICTCPRPDKSAWSL